MTDNKEELQQDLHKEIIDYLANAPQEELLGLLNDIAQVRPELVAQVAKELQEK